MAHIHADRAKLLARLARISGQVAGIERAIEQDEDCNSVLQIIAACRGALNGLMAQVIEGHVRFHVLDPKRAGGGQRRAAEQLLKVVGRYLK
jgi:DNA-binding FrmR family transcriptional regulator